MLLRGEQTRANLVAQRNTMRFLEDIELKEWCLEHAAEFDGDRNVPVLAQSSAEDRVVFAEDGRSGRESAAANACLQSLGDWDECLLVVCGWGVWPSSEDWPAYYALRGAAGEKRSLEAARSHLFSRGESAAVRRWLTCVMENGWDAMVMTASAGKLQARWAFVSHDMWFDIRRRK